MKLQRVTAELALGLLIVLDVTVLSRVSAQTSPAPEVALWAAKASTVVGAWNVVSDPTAAGGGALWNPDAGVAKLGSASATPASYFELTFTARAGTPYRLWIRGRAQNDYWTNDSLFAQFSGSVDANGAAVYRIGTTDATVVSLEDCSGCGEHAWGWQDNGYGPGVLGPAIWFAADGPQTIRIQVREDGLTIDQVVLSPQKYLTASPGATKDDATILPQSDGSQPAPAITLVRGPYLQQVTSSSAIVVWATRENGQAEVRYGTGTTLASSAPATGRLVANATTALGYDYYHYEAPVTGLGAAATYVYQPFVAGTAATAAPATFKTAPATGTGTVTFIAFGDSGTASAPQKQLASLMANDTFDLALHVGDIAYSPADVSGDATYALYQSGLFDIYKWFPSVGFAPVEGNHDSAPLNNNGRAYLDLFTLPTNGASAAFPDHAERYYSYDYGPIHFVALDTEFTFQDTTRRAEQLSWLENDLAATQQPWKIAYFHRPPYSSSSAHGSNLTVRAAFGPLFERYGVDLVLNGHDHDYERTIPIKESAIATDKAVPYVVTGGGGAELYPNGTSAWTAYSASVYEYVRVATEPCTLKLEAIGLDGGIFDSMSLSKCGTTPTDVVLWAADAPALTGAWVVQNDVSAAGGHFVVHPDAGAAKVTTASAAPANYVDLTFNAIAGVPYHLWFRGRAQNDYWGNDSAYAQFSGSVSSTGTPVYRIGTTDAATVVLEDCTGCGDAGWGWQDNGWGTNVMGPNVYFATTGPQRLRIQTREDGYQIDQVVLSPGRWLNASPGTLKNDATILTRSSGQ